MAELPQPQNVDILLVSEVNIPSPCCSCRKKDGILKCSGCQAVVYCSKECQERGWNQHRQISIVINQLFQEEKKKSGVEEGLFRIRDNYDSSEDPRNFLIYDNHGPTLADKYDIARWKLIHAYAKCGKETLSRLAFRLAAENLLHMLWLCRIRQRRSFFVSLHKYCGWMVAGGMDQQALNFLYYVICFGLNWSFGGLDLLDLSLDEDIEGVSLVQIVKERIPKTSQFTPRMWIHDFMLISLIKYKRLQALAAQRKEEEERLNTFMEGTLLSYGEIIKISGMSPVLEKLKGLVVDKSVDERVDLLTNQIHDLLNEVNEGNPKLIPGILDGHVQMVNNPTYPETDEDKDAKEFEVHFGISVITGIENDIHKARYGVGKYGHAWHIDKDCTRALRLFYETGNVMAEDNRIPTSHQSGKDANGEDFSKKDDENIMVKDEDTAI